MSKGYPDRIYFVFFFTDGNREVYENTGLPHKVLYSRHYDDGCLEFMFFYGRIRKKDLDSCPMNTRQLTSENTAIKYFDGSEDSKIQDLLVFLKERQRLGRVNLSDRFVRNLRKKKPWAFNGSEGPVNRFATELMRDEELKLALCYQIFIQVTMPYAGGQVEVLVSLYSYAKGIGENMAGYKESFESERDAAEWVAACGRDELQYFILPKFSGTKQANDGRNGRI